MATKKIQTPEEKKAAQKKLLIAGAIVLTLLIINFVYQIWRHYFYAPTPPPLTQATCNLHQQACSVILPKNRGVTLSVAPTTIPLDAPITFTVKLTNLPVKKVSIYLLALGIKDPHQQILVAKGGPDSYEAQTTLPKLDANKQRWMAMIVLETKDGTLGVPFKF